MAKTSAIEVRLDKLLDMLSSCNGYRYSYEFTLRYRILPGFHSNNGHR